MRRVHRLACSGLALGAGVLCPLALRAQGALSTQGFGYPGGQLSTRALAAGGSLADFDPNTPVNPAALVLPVRGQVYVQYDPEFRAVNAGGARVNTTTSRFPVFGVTGRFGRATVGLSFASFLDRTWTNTYPDTQVIGGEKVPSQVTASSAGGINDARVAVSYSFSDAYHIGLGLHVFPGENKVLIARDFDDSLRIGSFTQASLFNFSGSALSLGVLATPVPRVNVAASARFGGTLKMREGDSTVIGSARVPSRWSLSAAYVGYAGSTLSIRYASERWSDLRGLGSAGLVVNDATELAVGAEVSGPRFSGVPVGVRLGYRSRQLPFALDARGVNERALSGGLGIPLSAGRGAIDLGLSRAQRTSAGVSETGWILSVGLAIKP